jgi:restriction system protein
MATKMNYNIWMVRAGKGGYLIDEFLENNIVAIGWNDVGPIPKDITYDNLKKKFKEVYVDDSDGSVNQSVGQLWRFLNDLKIGDKLVSYDSSSRLYYLGEIVSEYKFNAEYEYHHYHEVKWEGSGIDRDLLPTDVKNVLGSILTIFKLDENVWDELKATRSESMVEIEKTDEQLLRYEKQEREQLKEDFAARSEEFAKDLIANLSWQDLERLVAGLMKALGYKIRMTIRGGDLGSDIIASADVLGLDGPQIKIEVKKRTGSKIGAPDIRNFLGGLRGHHKGIYVTTSGFTKEARYEAERANSQITLIDSDWLVELITTNYELLEPDIKALIPMRKIYWPV